MKFSDVADVLETGSGRNERKTSVESLRGQLPWSYIASSSTIADAKSTVDRTFCLSDSVRKKKSTWRSRYSGSGSDVNSKNFFTLYP